MTTFWDKLYIVFSVIVILSMLFSLKNLFFNSTKRRIDFIVRAQKNGTFVPCKLSCFTKEGNVASPYYTAEYMYEVNGKPYFVTYQINPIQITDTRKDEFDADMLTLNIKTYMILFYDAKNPKKVMCKAEPFVSAGAMHQIRTNQKHNAYRNIDSDWAEPIDLMRYI